MPSIGRPSGICGRPWLSRPTSTICSALRTGALIRNRRDSGGDAANLFGTFCPKEPGLGRLPNKHFCGPATQQKFRSVATPELLAISCASATWRKKTKVTLSYASSVSLAFLMPSAVASITTGSFSLIEFRSTSMCFLQELVCAPPSA